MKSGLEHKNDLELVEIVQSGINTNSAFKEILKRHSGIFYRMVHGFFSNSDSIYDKQYILDSKFFVIYQAVMDFDKSKNTKLASFIGTTARYFCLNHINEIKNSKCKEITLENLKQEESTQNPDVYKKFDQNTLQKAWKILDGLSDKRIAQIFKMRYEEAKGNKVVPWHLIHKKIKKNDGTHSHMSIQGCINLHEKGLNIIKERLCNVKI